MRDFRHALAALLAAAALAACGGGSEPSTGRAEGVIESVDPAAKQVTIDHGDIPGMMPAMTMTFDVTDPKLLEGLAAGNQVAFSVEYRDGKYLVTGIQRR
jgi:Cu/Ag efflux protein CusF